MIEVDVAVVGAGIVGCMVARMLTERAPEREIVVLDRDLAGSGASRRSAGVHFPRGATRRVQEMTELSHVYYEQLIIGRRLPIFPVQMSIVGRAADSAIDTYLALARPTRTTDVPGITLSRNQAAWNADGCHYADVGALVTAIAGDLRARVTFREGVAVSAVGPAEDGVTLHLGTSEHIRARQVVLAPGPWVHAPAWRALVAPLGIRVKQVVALHLERVPEPDDRLVVFQDVDAFLLPVAYRGHWLFSYTSQRWDVAPDELTGGLSEATVAEGRAVLAELAPDLAELALSGRVFCDAYSPNGEPIVRALDPHGRVVFAGAANGSGYRLAPAIAAETVALLHIGSGQGTSA